VSRINAVFPLPDPPEIPDILEFRTYASIRLTALTVEVSNRKSKRQYSWQQIDYVHIHREDAKRHDFDRLDLVIDNKCYRLLVKTEYYLTTTNWSGPEAEVVSAFFLKHCPATRLVQTAGPADMPDHPTALARMRSSIERDQLLGRRAAAIAVPLTLLWYFWFGFEEGFAKATIILLGYGVLIVPAFFSIYSRSVKRLETVTTLQTPT
jgi:hypothetical protein